MLQRLQASVREKKELEARHAKEVAEAAEKHRAEVDRKEQQRAQDIGRLQASVQEKAKALKVAELELQRLKAKGGALPAAARPAAAKLATTVPNMPAAPAPAAPRAAAAPPPAVDPFPNNEVEEPQEPTVVMSLNVAKAVVEQPQKKPGAPDDEWNDVVDAIDKLDG